MWSNMQDTGTQWPQSMSDVESQSPVSWRSGSNLPNAAKAHTSNIDVDLAVWNCMEASPWSSDCAKSWRVPNPLWLQAEAATEDEDLSKQHRPSCAPSANSKPINGFKHV